MNRIRLLIAASIVATVGLVSITSTAQAKEALPQSIVKASANVVKASGGGYWVTVTRYPSRYGTLASIAKSAYGKPALWTLIYSANRSRVQHPERIYVGQRLYVPVQGSKVRAATTASRSSARPTGASNRAAIVVAYAKAQVGDRYAWAATGPNAFDCSGLVVAAFRKIGKNVPHQSGALMRLGYKVSRANLRPGDLVFPRASGHVQIYVGGGRIVEASTYSTGVVNRKLWGFYTARRLI